MSEPPVFKRGAVRRSGSACAADHEAHLPPSAATATPCAAGASAGVSARRPPSPLSADAAQAREAAGGSSSEKRQKVSAADGGEAPGADGDPFAFEGSEAAAAAHAPRVAVRSALHRSGTPRARGQAAAKHVTWGVSTIHATPARETPPRETGFEAEPAGGGGGWAPAHYARPFSIVRDSGAQLAAVDEARYSLQSLSSLNPLDVRRSAVVALVTLAVDPDTRRLVRSHRLSVSMLQAACDLPVSLALPAAALLYLMSCDRPPVDDALALIAAAAEGGLTRLLKHPAVEVINGFPRYADPDAAMSDSSVRCTLRRARLPLAAGELVDVPTLALLTVELGCCLPAAPAGAGCDNVRAQFKASLRQSGALGVVAALTVAAARAVVLAAQEARALPAGQLLRCLRVLEQTSFVDARSAAFLLRWRPDAGGGAGASGGSGDEPRPRSRSASPDLLHSNPRGGISTALAWLNTTPAAPPPPHGGAIANEAGEAGDQDAASEAAVAAAADAAQAGGVVAALVRVLPALAAPPCDADGGAAKTCAAAIRAALNALTNLTNDRADGGAAFLAAGGVEAAAALLPALVGEALGPRFVGVDESPNAAPAAPPTKPASGGGSGSDALSAALCLLTNVVEVSPASAACLAAARTAAGAPFVFWLATLFVRTNAASAAGVLTGSGAGAAGGPADDADVTAEMLEASEREAVALITAAYSALLLGCVLRAAPEARQLAVDALPGASLSPLSAVLEKFCSFHESMRTLTPRASHTMRAVIDTLKKLDSPLATEPNGA